MLLEDPIEGRLAIESHIVRDRQHSILSVQRVTQTLADFINAIGIDERVKSLPNLLVEQLGNMMPANAQQLG